MRANLKPRQRRAEAMRATWSGLAMKGGGSGKGGTTTTTRWMRKERR